MVRRPELPSLNRRRVSAIDVQRAVDEAFKTVMPGGRAPMRVDRREVTRLRHMRMSIREIAFRLKTTEEYVKRVLYEEEK